MRLPKRQMLPGCVLSKESEDAPVRAKSQAKSRVPPSDDETRHPLLGRAGLVFAYCCFAVSIGTIGGAVYVLPIPLKAKIFLALAMLFIALLFAFMAIAAHLVSRPRSARRSGDDPSTHPAPLAHRNETGPKGG